MAEPWSALGQVWAEGLTPAARLLHLAALEACAAEVGWNPPRVALEPPPVAPPDARPVLEGKALHHLLRALEEGTPRLIALLLQQTADRGWRLPPPLLPRALDRGAEQTGLRPMVLAAAGPQGRWLASLSKRHQYALGVTDEGADIERLWREGGIDQRVEALRIQRSRDPEQGRQWLAAELSSLPAAHRAQLLGQLRQGLSLADEPLVQKLLADRSSEVRQQARWLALQLADSAHQARARARLLECRNAQGEFEPPQQAAAEWKADGIELTAPKDAGLGERGWWLYQLALQVPASWWLQAFEVEAEQLWSRFQQGTWDTALKRALLENLAVADDPALIRALLFQVPEHRRPELVARLPLADRQRYFDDLLLEHAARPSRILQEISMHLPLGQTLDDALSARLLQLLVEAGTGRDYADAYLIPEFGLSMAESLIDEFLAHERRLLRVDHTPAWWHKLRRDLAARQCFYALPKHISPTLEPT